MNHYPDQTGFVIRGALRGNGFNIMTQIIPEFLGLRIFFEQVLSQAQLHKTLHIS
jgi:hypothetical protein